MTNIRLLPVAILAVAALLVLKTMGLVTNGGYVLTGVGSVQAAGGGEAASGETVTLPSEPTIEDQSPTLTDTLPTLGAAVPASGGHGAGASDETGAAESHGGVDTAATDQGAPASAEGQGAAAGNVIAAQNACDPRPVAEDGETDTGDGELLTIPADCPLPADALPQVLTPDGTKTLGTGQESLTEQALLERLSARRTELESYEQELAMRASLVEAAEQRIEERQQTLQSIEDQIASLVEQRKEMEEGQFAGIVAMYETMKPKDAANIFNALDIEVLLRVAKMMSPRKMAPILAEMDTQRAQELTVRMAALSDTPVDQMAPDDLAALPQIIGQ